MGKMNFPTILFFKNTSVDVHLSYIVVVLLALYEYV